MPEERGSLSFAQKAGWGIGTLGSGSMVYLLNLFILYFLIQKLGIPAALAGTLLFVTRMYDSFADVTIGRLSDRTRSRLGRRRAWMLPGALLSGLATSLIFSLSPLESLAATAAVALLLLVLFYTGYSMFVIPSLAMPAEMTESPRERGDLMAHRSFFVILSGLVMMGGAPWLVGTLGGDREAYALLGHLAAVCISVPMLVAVYATRNVRARPPTTSVAPLLASLRAVWSNRPFVLLCASKFLVITGTTFSGASALFFFDYTLERDERSLALFGFVSSISGLAAIPLWRQTLRLGSKRTLFIVNLIGQGLVFGSWALATPAESQWIFITRSAVLGAFSSGTLLLMLSLLPETMEYDSLRTGQRREGLFAGVFGFVEKSAYAVSPLLAGFLFSATGLVEGNAPKEAQPEPALLAIVLGMSVIPAVIQLLALVTILLYRLDERGLEQLRTSARTSAGPHSEQTPA